MMATTGTRLRMNWDNEPATVLSHPCIAMHDKADKKTPTMI
uniref:Uncharacterized protein n=1 Tax=Arundo donax TaxID=35708 RepID=A0A0A8YKP9_ARUDO